jgi:hypothetical protein
MPQALRPATRHPGRGVSPSETYGRPRGVEPASPPTRPTLVELGGPSEHIRRRVSRCPVPRSLFGLSQAREVFRGAGGTGRLLAPVDLAPVAFASPSGFHPRLPAVSPLLAERRRGTPLMGFHALQHMPDPRVHLREDSNPRYVPSSGFQPSRRLPPREPSRPCFRPERSWASALQGFSPPGPSVLLPEPVTSTTLAARR